MESHIFFSLKIGSVSCFKLIKLSLTVDAMASAEIDCCSTVYQHKCKLRFQMFQRSRIPAFAIAFVVKRFYFTRLNIIEFSESKSVGLFPSKFIANFIVSLSINFAIQSNFPCSPLSNLVNIKST